ncbi:hypothetical protein NPIL_444121 [Nephila pilipes]|uniref:Uncharacterized protein n=1 Tax=Nephila pilipes TaxID=299642 RepID=A0A8X6TWY4_NEPPI|nr:hypothetical protein NPIL_444121 [Nephila pilipes]
MLYVLCNTHLGHFFSLKTCFEFGVPSRRKFSTSSLSSRQSSINPNQLVHSTLHQGDREFHKTSMTIRCDVLRRMSYSIGKTTQKKRLESKTFPDRTDVTLLTSTNERLRHRQVTHYIRQSRRACREQRMLKVFQITGKDT